MSNGLKMAEHQAIIGLWRLRWSYRRIAAELGIDRETVSRHVKAAGATFAEASAADPSGAGPPVPSAAIPIAGAAEVVAGGATGLGPGGPGSRDAAPGAGVVEGATSGNDSNAAIPIAGSAGPAAGGTGGAAVAGVACPVAGGAPPPPQTPPQAPAGRQSLCEPLREAVLAGLESGLSARRIWQDLRAEHDFAGDYQSVQRFCRKLREASPLPFRRMECEPGAEAQVDFGKGAPIVRADGRRTRPHLFRIVLSHSRKGYSEVVPRQTTELFLRCIENAFWSFGGVPRTLVPDNLKAAVLRADWYDPELNPKIAAFCEHYGTVLLPTRPRTPRHKGKIERGVGYAQSNAVKGRTFTSLAEQNAFLREWEATVADTRVHGTTRKQVAAAFVAERPALLPLPAGRFPCFQEARRVVNRDGHVEVAKAYYSAPPEFVGRTVWARWDGHTVRLLDDRLRQIALHAQREPGRFATDAKHIAPEKRGGVERGTAWWLTKAHAIGGHAGRWCESVLRQRGVHGVRVVMGLVGLAQRHPAAAVERACGVAASHGAYRLRDVRGLLKRSGPAQEQPPLPFATEHPLIRPLADYDEMIPTIRAAFDRTPVAPPGPANV